MSDLRARIRDYLEDNESLAEHDIAKMVDLLAECRDALGLLDETVRKTRAERRAEFEAELDAMAREVCADSPAGAFEACCDGDEWTIFCVGRHSGTPRPTDYGNGPTLLAAIRDQDGKVEGAEKEHSDE